MSKISKKNRVISFGGEKKTMLTYFYNVLYYFISFLFATFFLLLGILATILPWSTAVRTDLVSLILENSLAMSLFGFGFLVIGGFILISLLLRLRKRYYYIRVDHHAITVDETIIQHYLEEYWKQKFPNREIPSRLILKRNKIKIVADLPYSPKEERKKSISVIQNDLRDLLEKILGYSHSFVLRLSFKAKV